MTITLTCLSTSAVTNAAGTTYTANFQATGQSAFINGLTQAQAATLAIGTQYTLTVAVPS